MYFAEGDGGTEIHYLIDRKNDYYYVPGLHFPVPGDASFQNFHIGTIIDGELVNDTLPNGTVQLKYLVFDCLMLDGNSLMHRTLDKRLAYFRDKVYDPYKELYAKFPEEIQFLPFIVEFKSMEFSYAIEMMFKDILPNLPHGNDGLIFTARNSPYKFGTDEHILKWKPEDENSVDYRLNLEFPTREPDSEDEMDGDGDGGALLLDYDAMPRFHLSVMANRGEYVPYAEMYMTPAEWEEMKGLGIPLEDTIVECFQDREGRWRFLRFREDKKDANHISTVESVIESIRDKIGVKDLVSAAKKIRDEWKKRQKEEEDRRRREQEERRRKMVEGKQAADGLGGMNGGAAKRKAEEYSG
jgi:mRNA guanylyltransferase